MSFRYAVLDTRIRRFCFARQQLCIDKLVPTRGGIVWWKVGEGKTRIGLYIFARLQNIYKWSLPSVCLIVCRRRAFYDWKAEIRILFPSASVYEDSVPVYPPSNQPVFLLLSQAMVYKQYEELHENPAIRFAIFDELWLYANNKALRSKSVTRLSLGWKSVGLSGTVMKARNLDEVYCQAMVVQKHRYIAQNLTQFRSLSQTSLKIEKKDGTFFPKHTPKPGAYKAIMQSLSSVADVHFPKGKRIITEQYHTIPATKQQLQHFEDLREYYEVTLPSGNTIEYNHAVVIGIKAQQIANGWLKTLEGKIISIPSNKPEKLEDEISDILASGERAIVWCAFRYDVEMLADRLKFASLQMLGGEDFDIDRWQFGDIKLCLATEASGSSVNYFSQTPYAIYYSASYKWLDMQQSRGRSDRKSSRHSECFYKYLQVEESLDAHVYRVALASGNLEARLIHQAGVSDWLKKGKQ